MDFSIFDILTMWGTLLAVGAIADAHFISHSQNSSIYKVIFEYWEQVELIKIPDIPRSIAKTYTSNRLLLVSGSIVTLIVIGVIGLAFTAKYAILVESDIPGIFYPLFPDISSALKAYLSSPGSIVSVLFIQLFFTAISIGVTILFLEKISKSRSSISLFITADICIAIFIAFLTLYVLEIYNSKSYKALNIQPPEMLYIYSSALKGGAWLLGYNSGLNEIGNPGSAVYMGTVILPSLFFHITIVAGIFVKYSLALSRRTVELFMRALVEIGMIKNKDPLSLPMGSLIATVCSLCISLMLLFYRIF